MKEEIDNKELDRLLKEEGFRSPVHPRSLTNNGQGGPLVREVCDDTPDPWDLPKVTVEDGA